MPRLFARLPPTYRKKILSYIEAPSYAAWVDVRDIIVAPGLSLQDMVDSITYNYPVEGPNSILVARTSALIEQRHKDLAALDMPPIW